MQGDSGPSPFPKNKPPQADAPQSETAGKEKKKKDIDHKEHKEHKKSRGYRQEFSFVPFVFFVVKKSVFHLRRFYSAAAWVSNPHRASTCLRSVVSAPMLTLSSWVPLRTDGVR